MSAAEQNPDHAGEQYTSLAATVARKTSYSEVAGMPCVRKIRRDQNTTTERSWQYKFGSRFRKVYFFPVFVTSIT